MVFSDRWECPWCLDSGLFLPPLRPSGRVWLRILCSVDFPQTWKDLQSELCALVPRHAEALLPLLGRAAAHQISASPPPADGAVEPSFLRDLRRFLDEPGGLDLPADTAARIERGELLLAEEGALSPSLFGSFWQALLDALEDEGAVPWEADTDALFRSLAVLRGWRRGGPGNDPDYLDNIHRLQDAFHARWLERHPEKE
jgi:hypothetical protein